MAKLKTKFIEDNAVNEDKIKLSNNSALRARNAADSADVDLIKLNASDAVEFPSRPNVGGDDVLLASDKGAASGVASLDGSGKVPTSQLPAIALTEIDVVADIAARDALSPQEGDVAVVTDASSDPEVTSGPASYIYDGSAWQRLGLPDETVISVNGETGAVTLTANEVDLTGGYAASAGTVAGGDDLQTAVAKLDGNQQEIDQNVDDLITLSGVAENATDLGTFTGSTISDNRKVKEALQDLETAIEGSVGATSAREIFTLNSTDITNGYVDLAQDAIEASVIVTPVGGLQQEFTADFTLGGSPTRVTFAGDLSSELASGDKLQIYYEY